MKNAILMMCLTAVLAALAPAKAAASPSYSMVSQERTINVSTQTGQTSDSDSAAALDAGAFNEARQATSSWSDASLPMAPFYTATSDASQNSTIGSTVLTADLTSAVEVGEVGSGSAISLYKIVFDIPANRPAVLTVQLDIDVTYISSEARVELSGVDTFVLDESSLPSGDGSDTFGATRNYNLAPGRYTFSVSATSDAGALGHSDGRSDAYAQLTITPEPATLSLLAIGGMSLLRRRRRR